MLTLIIVKQYLKVFIQDLEAQHCSQQKTNSAVNGDEITFV